jgi:antitoxin component YwqK of YwqJK toxin-antitoxin module
MTRHLLPALAILFLATGCATQHYVASKYPNGKPEVVIYTEGKGEEAVKVMERVYYPNGKLDYVGRFKDGREHGEWTYYYEDGTLKYKENWANGLEDGVQIEYAPDGQPYLEKYYENGKLVRTVDTSK